MEDNHSQKKHKKLLSIAQEISRSNKPESDWLAQQYTDIYNFLKNAEINGG